MDRAHRFFLETDNMVNRWFATTNCIQMLQMFCIADPSYDKTLQQLQSFLSGLVAEEKLELRDGMYSLKKWWTDRFVTQPKPIERRDSSHLKEQIYIYTHKLFHIYIYIHMGIMKWEWTYPQHMFAFFDKRYVCSFVMAVNISKIRFCGTYFNNFFLYWMMIR